MFTLHTTHPHNYTINPQVETHQGAHATPHLKHATSSHVLDRSSSSSIMVRKLRDHSTTSGEVGEFPGLLSIYLAGFLFPIDSACGALTTTLYSTKTGYDSHMQPHLTAQRPNAWLSLDPVRPILTIPPGCNFGLDMGLLLLTINRCIQHTLTSCASLSHTRPFLCHFKKHHTLACDMHFVSSAIPSNPYLSAHRGSSHVASSLVLTILTRLYAHTPITAISRV